MSSNTDIFSNTMISLKDSGIGMDLKSINGQLNSLFNRYSIVLNKITGNDIFGKTQVHQLQDETGLSIEYDKGQMAIKNGIDQLKFLLDNRKIVASTLNIKDSDDIFNDRRNLIKMQTYLMKLNGRYELGDIYSDPQIFIAKNNDVVTSVDTENDWIYYILSKSWIDKLANRLIGKESSSYDVGTDYRIEYLYETLKQMMEDHVAQYHTNINSFSGTEFIDKNKGADDFQTAYNKLHSFGKLNYCFYELYKPFGKSREKYLKVKMYTNGRMDIQGVIGLIDCTYVPWEYGSPDYLRYLNTGNKRYEFKLSVPFNDKNSILWWKPDEKEQIEVEKDEWGRPEDPVYRYYKPYEIERFIRWFGSSYVPLFDLDTITKKTICSAPILSSDIQSEKFYEDSNNITTADLSRANIDTSTSQSLLTLATKSTIEIINKDDGQYISLVVSGNQQTSNIAFHLSGSILPIVQDINHYCNTLERIDTLYKLINTYIIKFEILRLIRPSIEYNWSEYVTTNKINDVTDYIPDTWIEIKDKLEGIIWNPSGVDLIRFRNIYIESILNQVLQQIDNRVNFIRESNDNTYLGTYSTINNSIVNFIRTDSSVEQDKYISQLGISQEMQNVISQTITNLYSSKYDMSFDMNVDELRDTITTYNNLIVRLPVDTDSNKITSLHIFQDWKVFIDRTISNLKQQGLLFSQDGVSQEFGTDNIKHTFTELYTDIDMKTPLIDYSYRFEKTAEDGATDVVLHDRWDFWTENDFWTNVDGNEYTDPFIGISERYLYSEMESDSN